jgi:hypothetical protein
MYFYLAALGFCLFAYGYISAKVSCGNAAISLTAFFVGFPMLVYSCFKVVEAAQ